MRSARAPLPANTARVRFGRPCVKKEAWFKGNRSSGPVFARLTRNDLTLLSDCGGLEPTRRLRRLL
ncbi:hypothetical protein SPHV1_2290017 [Novosphingobium sp. KN65.2]|nr:hypothetical protein SPHV1_2290017 [Novosphingobium sp. KN65.2]